MGKQGQQASVRSWRTLPTPPANHARPGPRRIGLGALALLFFVIHATFHATRGRPYDILWNCTLSNVLIGVGLLAGRSAPVAIGVTWLCLGNLFCLADVLTGGEFFTTSTLTHFGGLTVGVLGVRTLGWPRHTWLFATPGVRWWSRGTMARRRWSRSSRAVAMTC